MNHSEYIALGRDLATRHKLVRHIEGSDEAFHFARIVLSVNPMGGDNIEEFIEALRNKIRFPFVLWQAYDHTYRGDQGDNILKVYQGAFILLMNPEANNYQAEEEAYNIAEKIGEDFLSKLKADFAKLLSNRFIFLADATAEKLGPVHDNITGLRFSFSFQKTANQALHFNPENWI